MRKREVVLAWGPITPKPNLHLPSPRIDWHEPINLVWFWFHWVTNNLVWSGFPLITQSFPLLSELGSCLQGPHGTLFTLNSQGLTEGCKWEKESWPLFQIPWEHQETPSCLIDVREVVTEGQGTLTENTRASTGAAHSCSMAKVPTEEAPGFIPG